MMTIDRLQARLAELRREQASGEALLQDLARQEAALRQTLLRISGAIQVLEELAAPDPAAAPTPAPTQAPTPAPCAPAGTDDRPDQRILTVG